MKENVLAKFDYKDKTYVYYTLDGNSNDLLYGILKDDQILPIENDEDNLIMKEVGRNIFISNDIENYIKLETMKHRGKLFQVMYDKVSKMKFFYEIKNGKLVQPDLKDLEELFSMFYELSNFFIPVENDSEKLTNNRKKRKIKLGRIVLLYGTIVTVIFSSSFCCAKSISTDDTGFTISEVLDSYGNELTDEEYREKLDNALNSNPNLSVEEKAFFSEHLPSLVKYRKYVDLDYEIKILNTLRTKYDSGGDPNDPSIAAYYNPSLNEIVCNYASNFSESSKTSMGHEFEHATEKSYYHPGIYESTTEIINSEHEHCDDISAYHQISALQKILYQLIGAEPFMAYQKSGDIKYLSRPLMKIIDNEDLFERLINSLDNIIVYRREEYLKSISSEYTDAEKLEAKENRENIEKIAIEIVGDYFYAKMGYKMVEDPISMLYLKKAGMITDNISLQYNSENIGPCYLNNFSLKKGYFEDKYIRKYPEYTLSYYNEDKKLKVLIDGDVRLIKTSDGYVLNKKFEYIDSIDNDEESDNDEEENGAGFISNEESSIYDMPKDSETKEELYKAIKSLILYESNYGESNNFIAYKEQVMYIKLLCELIGTQPFENFLQTGNLDEIKNPLIELDKEGNDPQYDAYRLLAYIAKTSRVYEKTVDVTKTQDPNIESIASDEVLRLEEDRRLIHKIINNYYLEAKGHGINNDLIGNLYYQELFRNAGKKYENFLSEIHYINGDENEIVLNKDLNAVAIKGYFVQSYKDVFPDTVIQGNNGIITKISEDKSTKMQTLYSSKVSKPISEKLAYEGLDKFLFFENQKTKEMN